MSLRSSLNRTARSLISMAALSVLLAGPSWSQDASAFPLGEARNVPILLLDQERLLRESQLGKAFLKASRDRERNLVERRRRIDRALEAEEKRLTDLRDTTPTDEFRLLADDFDQKVVRLRAEQEQASVALAQEIEENRKGFFQQAAPVIASIMSDFGASVVLEQRLVLVSANGLNITDRAIDRLDSKFRTSDPQTPALQTQEQDNQGTAPSE